MSGPTTDRILLLVLMVAACSQALNRRPDASSSGTTDPENSASAHSEDKKVLASSGTSSLADLSRHEATFIARHTQGDLCPERCNGTQLVNRMVTSRCMQCAPCTCLLFCETHGTCCPQVGEAWRPPALERSECRLDYDKVRVLHVLACHPHFPPGHTRDLCESRSSPRRRDTLIPVTSTVTNVTYANIHCAECNHDNQSVVPWTVVCRHNQHLYPAVNDTQYDDLALRHPDICRVSSYPADHLGYYTCPSKRDIQVVSSCNSTGSWPAEDAVTRDGCEKSDWLRGDVVSVKGSRFYANVLCATCNEDPADLLDARCLTSRGIDQSETLVRTTTGLLEFDFDHHSPVYTVSTLTGCPQHQWKHPQRGCQDLQCPPGKTLVGGDRCVTRVSRVRALGYHLSLHLRPVLLQYHPAPRTRDVPSRAAFSTSTSRLHVCDYGMLVAKAMIVTMLESDFASDWSANITTTTSLPAVSCWVTVTRLLQHSNVTLLDRDATDLDIADNPDFSILQADIEADIIATDKIGRDSFETDAVERFFRHPWLVRLGDWTVQLKAVDPSSGFRADGELPAGVDKDRMMNGTQQTSLLYSLPSGSHPLHGLETLFLPLTEGLLCPHTAFEAGEFEVTASAGRWLISFPHYYDQEEDPVGWEEASHPNTAWVNGEGQLVVCVDTVLSVFPANVTVVRPGPGSGSGPSLVRQVVSAVCGTVSVVLLAFTFLTYALFRQLRSLPGLNNMALSLSLGTAQLILLLPWHRARSARTCSAVGVATHWAWLIALGWMGVCCGHMVRVFVSKTRRAPTPRHTNTTFLRNIVVTVVLSTTIVATTVAVSLALTHGDRIGYGGPTCFLDTGVHPLLLLFFLLPLGGVVVCNLACFLFTVAAIMRVRRLQARAPTGRRDVLVYVKLVTVTGGAWGLGLLAQWLDQEWLLVVAELCTAAQGLLLFLAYTCNTRVWHLYRARCGCPAWPAAPTTSTTAVTTSASHP